MPEYGLTQFDPMNLEPLALLFQTGYLTLQGTEAFGDENDYILGFPKSGSGALFYVIDGIRLHGNTHP